jgi:hypothetical protein
MGKTYRSEPSNGTYHKRQKHVGHRRIEEETEEYLSEYPIHKANRIKSAKSRIPDPWDDKVVSEYRGQDWHRNKP